MKNQSAHYIHCAAAKKLTHLWLSINGGGARFENPETSETMGLDLPSSFRSQSLTEEPGVGEEPIKPDQAG